MIDEKHNHTFYNNFSFKLLVIWQQLQFHEKCLYIVLIPQYYESYHVYSKHLDIENQIKLI